MLLKPTHLFHDYDQDTSKLLGELDQRRQKENFASFSY